ncbi:MAG: dihydroorotate dehydrogenase electron transfer subunit [Pirellulaceae bacterium]
MTSEGICYADNACHQAVEIVRHEEVGRSTRLLAVRCPEIAKRILPGQFVMLRPHGIYDPLIGRPLALFDVWYEGGEPAGIEVVYLVKGKLTSWLAEQAIGQTVEIWGPLGNGFDPQPTDHLVLVAGGIGQTPFLAVAKERLGIATFGLPNRNASNVSRITLCYGARTADYHAGVDRFQEVGIDVQLATDDGTAGHHGLVTTLLEKVLAGEPKALRTQVLTCGPERMMEAVAGVAAEFDLPCQVSLETPMACGIGICFTCVAAIATKDGWDYRRTCIEGPVFNAADVVWDTTK